MTSRRGVPHRRVSAAFERRLEPGRRARVGDVLGGHVHLRRHRVHDVQQRARDHRHFLAVGCRAAEDELEFRRLGVEAEQLAQLAEK